MKKIYLLGSLLFAALTFTACSDDDNNDVVVNQLDPTTIVGTYQLVAVNTEQPTDFNRDGVANTNQMLETQCYNTAKITFSSLHDKFSYDRHRLSVGGLQPTALCDDLTIIGDWERVAGTSTNGTFKLTFIDGASNTRTMEFVKEGLTLKYTMMSGPYPDRDSAGNPIETPGKIEYVFSKIQDPVL